MSMNVDMLKMLYMNTVNNNANSLNNNVGAISGQDSFLNILNNAILGNYSSSTNKDLLNSIIGNSKDEDIKNNDLLTSLMLLMQQGMPIQGNYVNYENLINNLKNSDSLSIDTLNNAIQNIQSTTNLSYENLENLILGLQNQNDTNVKTSANTENNEVAALKNESEDLFAGRSFPKEVMESINALRQARDNIRSAMEQTKNITGRNTTAEAISGSNNESLATIPLEKYNSLNGMTVTIAKDETVPDNAQNSAIKLDFGINTKSAKADNLINQDFKLNEDAVAKSENIEVNGKIPAEDIKDAKTGIISDELLRANGIDIQNSSSTIKINDESSIIKDSVMTQIKDQIVLMKSDGKQTVTMQLTPEKLGKLDIKMVFEKGNLSVEILASDPKTHSLILSNISELKSVLQNSIIDRTFVNVDNQKQMYEQNQNQNNQGHSHNQGRNDSDEREYQQAYTDTSDNNDEIDFMTELTRLRDYRFSTVS